MQLSQKQQTIWNAPKRRWNFAIGAVQSGKTYLSYFTLLKRVLEQPPGNIALIGKTERTLRRNVIVPMRDLFGSKIISQVYGDGQIKIAGRMCYIYGANDARAVTKIQGAQFVYAYGDEIPTWPQTFFEMLRSRLSPVGACFDGTGNPEGPYHWFKVNVIDHEPAERALPKGKPIKLTRNYFHFILYDNPFLDPDYVSALESEYTGMWKKRYIDGLWAAAEGAIYDMFDEALHVVESVPENVKILRWFSAVDYGTVNPCVFYLIGLGNDEKFYVVDEYRWDSVEHTGRQKTDAQYSKDYAAFINRWRVQPEWCFIDPSAQSFITQMHHDNVYGVYEADNAVLDGIRRMAMLMAAGRLKILKRCKHLIAEISGYVWDSKAQERGEDAPLKIADHGDRKSVV